MTEQSRKPFNLAAKDAPLRDKDNAHPKLEPKLAKKTPAPNLAPAGAMGIRQGLKGKEAPAPAKRFSLGKPGDAAKEFKFAARNTPDKDRSRGR
ncbi:hypothetical protein [Phaeobacter inhibens]|uniref:hypothetical protein n=1 Tax=Phaeobacter inhibens TaxID=221822 RepID=UPI0021A49E81|nr:hypothetical protein [Phaeobacter inhibens]UWR87822.1 hypothetical protein K4L01_13785 [Phaeobacter inhibens]